MTGPGQELTFLSDLHMAAGGPAEPFNDDAALAALIDDLAAAVRPGGPARRLVLLGDFVDLVIAGASGRGPAAAAAGLERIAAAHPQVFAALARAARGGLAIDVLPGNHDAELALPPVARALGALVPGARVRPWLLHVPGLVLAEHGQQHHAINRFPALPALATGAQRNVTPLPSAAVYDALTARRPAGGAAARHLVALAAAAPRLAAGLVRARGRGRVNTDAEGLPAAALVALDDAAVASVRADGRRRARAAARRPGTPSFAAMLPGAAARSHAVLARFGATVPFYVFGHTHVAADVPLASVPHARYLNCGAWIPERTLVTLGLAPGRRAYGRLERWDPESRLRSAA